MIWFLTGWACGVLTVPLVAHVLVWAFMTRLSADVAGS